MEEILFLIGRILFGGFFAMNGFNHLKNLSGLTQYASSKNVPMAKAAVISSGLLILLGGLGVVFYLYVEISLWMIVIFLLGVSFKMHNFWAVSNDQKMVEQTNFTKNMALLGAALIMLAIL